MKKKEYLILAVIIVGLSLYLVFHQADQTHYALPTLKTLEKADISKIEISKGDTSLTVKRGTDGWKLEPEGYPADTGKVDDMLETITGLTLTDLVSESENYARYDLNAENRIHVRAYADGAVIRNFEIGKAAASFRHTYVKLDGNPRVYHARKNFRNHFDIDIEALRDKTALSFNSADIKEIAYTKGGVSRVLQYVAVPKPESESSDDSAPDTGAKKSDADKPAAGKDTAYEWRAADDMPLDAAKVKRLMNTVSHLTCNGYIEAKEKADFKDPLYTVEMKGPETHRLSIFAKIKEGDSAYPAVSSQNAYPFLLNATQAETIMNLFDPPKTASPEKTPKDAPGV